VTRQNRKECSSAYRFDGSISWEVLDNYLDRSITMGYFLVPGKPEGYELPSGRMISGGSGISVQNSLEELFTVGEKKAS
jgi:hypothetical protein